MSLDSKDLEKLIRDGNGEEVLQYLVGLNCKLKNYEEKESEIDYSQVLYQLSQLLERYKTTYGSQDKPRDNAENERANSLGFSLNCIKLLSRNLVLVLSKLPTKVHDFANDLLNFIIIQDESSISPISKLSIVILIDLFESFPNSLGSLVSFTVSQIYKVLKKHPRVSSSLIYLLNTTTKLATRGDIDDKLFQKLLKIVTRNIVQYPVSFELGKDKEVNSENSTTILVKKNYVLTLKNLLCLSVSVNYVNLLTILTSSHSAGSKISPDSLMSHQNQFQNNLLISHQKTIFYALGNYCPEIRLAGIDLISNLLFNFVATGKFNAVEYLLDQIPLPRANANHEQFGYMFSNSLDEKKADHNQIETHDSENIIHSELENLLLASSLLQSLTFYLQLQLFQDSNFLATNLQDLLDMILLKFSDLNGSVNPIQNKFLDKVLDQFSVLIGFIIEESGPSCHEVLKNYIYSKFSLQALGHNVGRGNPSTRHQRSFAHSEKGPSIFPFKSSKSRYDKQTLDSKLLILPYLNNYQCFLLLRMIQKLLPYRLDFSAASQVKDEEGNTFDGDTKDDSGERGETSEEIEILPRSSFLSETLFKLIVNDNVNIRLLAIQTLLQYVKYNDSNINWVFQRLFDFVSQEYEDYGKSLSTNDQENVSPLSELRLIYYSLALLALIKNSNTLELQNSLIFRVLSFCTQNLKHMNSGKGSKNCSCWIILSSIITFYNELEFVRLNLSQILVFWKSLLTTQYMGSSLSDNVEEQKGEIVENLKLRNSSLIAFLQYLDSLELSPESLRQVQFLLTKSYNYLTYLENSFPTLGVITSLSSYQLNDISLRAGLSNFEFSFSKENHKSKEEQMVNLILYGKRVILQCFLKIASFIKNDLNASIIIYLVKLFSDSKLFSRSFGADHHKEKPKKKKILHKRVNDFDSHDLYLGETFNYSFGVSSKFLNDEGKIDKLMVCRSMNNVNSRDEMHNKDEFGLIKDQENSKVEYWFDSFMKNIGFSFDSNIVHDPFQFLCGRYSMERPYSPNLLVSLVDTAIELFELIFPYLSAKIQYSLLEQMQSFTSVSSIDPLRKESCVINVSLAIHGLLEGALNEKQTIDKEIALLCLGIMDKIDFKNLPIALINAESVGLACGNLKIHKSIVTEKISYYVKRIVEDTEPYQRGYSILALSKIYKYSGFGLADVLDIGLQLLKDPNPIIHHFTLRSMAVLVDNNMDMLSHISKLLLTLSDVFLDDRYGYDYRNLLLSNLKCKYRSTGLTVELVRKCITILGPSLRELNPNLKFRLEYLITSPSYAIGCETANDYLEVYQNLLDVLCEVVIYDSTLIKGERRFFTDLLNFIISKNIKKALVSTTPTSIHEEAIFPMNLSSELYKLACSSYMELVKIFGAKILSTETLKLLWTCMNLKPCEELKQLISSWVESNLSVNSVAVLCSLFKSSSQQLAQPFINVNYHEKLLPLQQRQKKAHQNAILLKDDEVESIVTETSNDVSEPINYELKVFVYQLLNKILKIASTNKDVLNNVQNRIQELVKIAFLGANSSIFEMEMGGLQLLNNIIDLFGDMEDPSFQGASLLEQQQAQIIGSIIPCFKVNNNPKIVSYAIELASKFINLRKIKFYSKHRIMETLIKLLEELSSSKFIRFKFLESTSEYNKKAIQLSIMNAWALLKISSQGSDGVEKELFDILGEYSVLLNSSWISLIKEYSTSKYSENNSKDVENYEEFWLNYVKSLSTDLIEEAFVNRYLGIEAKTFFFVLFSQCLESLLKKRKIQETLITLQKLTEIPDILQFIFDPDIFEEFCLLLDRLLLMEDNLEAKCLVLRLIRVIIQNSAVQKFDSQEILGYTIELTKTCMSPLFSIIPFLRTDFDTSDPVIKLAMRQSLSEDSKVILSSIFQNVSEMLPYLPLELKSDIFAVLLFIISKIYRRKNETLISMVLPYLKEIIVRCSDVSDIDKLLEIFHNTIRETFDIDRAYSFTYLTPIILATNSGINLDSEESKNLSSCLVGLLCSPQTSSTGILCIRSLIQHVPSNKLDFLMKSLVRELVQRLLKDSNLDAKVGFETLLLFYNYESFDHGKVCIFYSFLMALLLHLSEKDVLDKDYLHNKLLALLRKNSGAFKYAIDHLSEHQKRLAETLLKEQYVEKENGSSVLDHSEIQLKNFGAS